MVTRTQLASKTRNTSATRSQLAQRTLQQATLQKEKQRKLQEQRRIQQQKLQAQQKAQAPQSVEIGGQRFSAEAVAKASRHLQRKFAGLKSAELYGSPEAVQAVQAMIASGYRNLSSKDIRNRLSTGATARIQGFRSLEEMQSVSDLATRGINQKMDKTPDQKGFKVIKTGEEKISTEQIIPKGKQSLVIATGEGSVLPQTVAFEDTELGRGLFKSTQFTPIIKDLNKSRKPTASDERLSRFERFVKAPYFMTPFGAESILATSETQKQRETGLSKWVSGLTYSEAIAGLKAQKFKEKTSARQQRDIDAFLEKLDKTPENQKYDVYTKGLAELEAKGVSTRPAFITDEKGLITTGREFTSPSFDPSYTFGRYQLKKEDTGVGKALLFTRIASTKATEMYYGTKVAQPVFRGIGVGIGKVAALEKGISIYGKSGGIATNLIRLKTPILTAVNIGATGLYAGTKFKQYKTLSDEADKLDFWAKTGGEIGGVGLALYGDDVVRAGKKFIKGFKESNRRMMLDKRGTMGRPKGRSRTQQKQTKQIDKKKANAYVRQFDEIYDKGGAEPIKDYLKKASAVVKGVKDPDMKTAGRDNLKFFLDYAKQQGYIKGYVLADDGSVAFLGDEGVLFAGSTPKPTTTSVKPITNPAVDGLPKMVGGSGLSVEAPTISGKAIVDIDQPVIWTSALSTQPKSKYVQTPDNIFKTDVKTGADTFSFLGSASATKTDTGLISKTAQIPLIDSLAKTDTLQESSTKTDVALVSALGLRTSQKPKTTQKQISSLVSSTAFFSRPTRRMIRQIEKPIKPTLLLPRPKTLRRKRATARRRIKQNPFVVEIKRFGKWKPIGVSTSLIKATRKGRVKAETTLARSFRVRRGSQLIGVPLSQGFRRSKRDPFVQVEKARRSLSQFGEKREIAYWRQVKKKPAKKKSIKRKKKKK